ncbi:lipid-A-disaccharide synthase [Bacteroidia bacterium]|nr:lipid-A-disaccharide synthase [Bacteroidia bacterium]
MKYYLIAGEASGDLHGANLIRGIKQCDPQAVFRFWGGDRMAEAGGTSSLARHYKSASFFGMMGVVANLRTILAQFRECRRDIAAFAPDVLILIDYPGFNFRMARFAHKCGIRTFYYISPKVWAWKEGRVRLIRKYVDHLFIIFPFEVDYFRRRGIEAIFEGNPLVDALAGQMSAMPSRRQFIEQNGLDGSKPIVALLAGSRRSEIGYNLPFMVELASHFPDCQFVAGGVPWLERELYNRHLQGSDVRIVFDQTYALLRHAEAAVVTSGTATLETALIGTPEMVCYRVDALSMTVAKLFIKIPYVSLVNIIMDREVVREMLQWDMTMANATAELRALLPGGERREQMLADFALLHKKVGGPGASDRFAARMVELLK